MKVKFFSATPQGPIWSRKDPVSELEKVVNSWLAENPTIKVVAIQQSAAGGSLNPVTYIVSVWYEPSA